MMCRSAARLDWTHKPRHDTGVSYGIIAGLTMAKTTRLKTQDWLAAGLQALAAQGPEALKAEPLARVLGTTKGSFYWHFADVPAFHAALLADWTSQANTALFDAAEQAATHTAALRRMAQQIAAPPSDDRHATAEPAMRAWAASHDGARKAVEQVDAARLTVIAALLERVGVSNPEMARIILATATGLPRTAPAGPVGESMGDPMGTLVDLVLALR